MVEGFYKPTALGASPEAHHPAYAATDLTTCDTEPIHIPGAIQPHGVLIALDGAQRVVAISANCADQLGPAPSGAIGLSLEELVGADLARRVRALSHRPAETDLFPVQLPTGHRRLTGALAGQLAEVRTHLSANRLIVEIEPVDDHAVSGQSLRTAHRAIGRLAATADVISLAAQLSEEVRDLLGFDRVMVYRFDAEWNGEVIADARHPDLNPFLGLHYPATDIPAQARRLYTVNWLRLIADVGYTPVPLEPVLDPETAAPLDLSFSSLRSVSPIHLEYLANMGVTASLSVSIVIDGNLWGLVACHHYSGPHRPSQDARAAAELLGQVASQMFFDRELAESRSVAFELRQRQSAIAEAISASEGDPVETLMAHPDVAAFLGASAVVVRNGDQVITRGDVPPLEVLDHVAQLLESPEDYATASDHLSTLDEGLAGFADIAAGAIRIGSAADRYMLWLRSEQVQHVDWGGDPTNKLLAAQEGPEVRLSPRKSFEKWQQVVRGRSAPWTSAELAAAEALGMDMQGVIIGRAREQMALAESLRESVELDRVPSHPGVRVAARYLPSSVYQLAGDWWDVVPLADGRAGFVVADVAGHGVSAASAMVQMRAVLRAFLFAGDEPTTCLDKLDAFVVAMMPGQVATAAVLVVDPGSGTVRGATAGHPPVVIDEGDGPRVLELAHRPVLGVGVEGHFVGPEEFVMRPGAAALLYSDGLVERRGTVITESIASLSTPTLAIAGDTPETWLDRVLAHVEPENGDDVTLLAFRLQN